MVIWAWAGSRVIDFDRQKTDWPRHNATFVDFYTFSPLLSLTLVINKLQPTACYVRARLTPGSFWLRTYTTRVKFLPSLRP